MVNQQGGLTMSMEKFDRWLDDVTGRNWYWYIKRLSANDTLASGSHQAGPYIPKSVFFRLFPRLRQSQSANPDTHLTCTVDSHGEPDREVRAIWYNQKTRDECRTTGWGGSSSPLLDPDATGSVCIFSFSQAGDNNSEHCRVWLCNLAEEEFFVDRFGPVEPGQPVFMQNGHHIDSGIEDEREKDCWLTETEMPASWLHDFPSAWDIVQKTIQMRPLGNSDPDQRLILRRDCEYRMFRSVEQIVVLPRIVKGFKNVDEFIEYSNSVNNRRKSRSGRSLELHLKGIFDEESVSCSHGEVSEKNKKPDFIFPSVQAYRKKRQPLFMLAAKTTCKDRWRQILNEADQIPVKHLITLQEGISKNQFDEMKEAGVRLVVPSTLHRSYPESIRPELLDLKGFISLVSAG